MTIDRPEKTGTRTTGGVTRRQAFLLSGSKTCRMGSRVHRSLGKSEKYSMDHHTTESTRWDHKVPNPSPLLMALFRWH